MTNDGVGLTVRLHDLLLALAGRVDDDALTQVRELLAVAELDRAVELLVGCLLAGRIPVSVDERREIGRLLGEVRSDGSLADRLFAVESVPVPRHRFTAESDPAEGLAEVLGKTASVLPDVRSVRVTWRSSPAGATPGPLPQRVVLVEIGPAGFAPATAYRLDTVLRKAGIRAAVEVLTAGAPLGDYHAAAVTTAREVFFQTAAPPSASQDPVTWFAGAEVRDEAPVVEPAPVPVEPETGSKPRRARVDPFEGAQFEGAQFEGAQPFPPKPVKRLPVRDLPAEPVVVAEPDEPRPGDHRAPAEHAVDQAAVEQVGRTDHAPVDHAPVEHSVVEHAPVEHSVVQHVSVVDLGTAEEPPADAEPGREPHRADHEAEHGDQHRAQEEQGQAHRSPAEEPPLLRSEVTTELGPDDLAALQAALADGQAPASAVPLPPTVDAKLSDRERALLQQLHEELAQREQQPWSSSPEFVNGVRKPNNGNYSG
ncbi:hypothetical protein [Saccharothrix australiensis]|uniref:Uncharacterized protein n=1 Tax=Saccharothrix australiensis TaxID=2072 RepID=A0A495VUJ8_9PSEU|nr:hypothetical protein [Saccharothrix australiensis]RKT52105.1 hypothetical protein C8E97_0605 [Saccharothrix australiensis]